MSLFELLEDSQVDLSEKLQAIRTANQNPAPGADLSPSGQALLLERSLASSRKEPGLTEDTHSLIEGIKEAERDARAYSSYGFTQKIDELLEKYY